MTPEEAKAELLRLKFSEKISLITGEAISAAKEALNKQIPKKPDYEGDGYADGDLVYDTWICPRCGERYEVDYDEYDYCPKCGQSLDWSDEQKGGEAPKMPEYFQWKDDFTRAFELYNFIMLEECAGRKAREKEDKSNV